MVCPHCADHRGATHLPDPGVPGIHVDEVLFAPAERLERHHHDLARICVVVSGGFAEVSDGRTRAAIPGTVYYLPAGATHAQTLGAIGARGFRVKMSLNDLADLAIDTPAVERPWFTIGGPTAWNALRLWRDFQLHDGDQLAADEFILRCLTTSRRDRHEVAPRGPAWLWRVRDRLLASPFPAPRLAELAALADVHPMHLTRTFRNKFGISVGEFSQTVRLARACELLVVSHLTICQISLALGYSDQAHFTRHFRARLGVPPAIYRGLRIHRGSQMAVRDGF